MRRTAIHEYEEICQIAVSMHDTDSMGVVWHGSYLKYFERAREQLLSRHGITYKTMIDSGICYPIVEQKASYRRFITLKDGQIKVKAYIEEASARLKIGYEVYTEKGELACFGYTVQVALSVADKQMLYALPEIFSKEFPKCVF
ncbi:MAG TPA: 4-hydroxybenzoyl-CoA thioesterase [Succinivibrionaceae bacterium]|nr:4-hydroxybenzoyl-CoA thioesterase [Succinivibrionaceae bacterium]